MRTSTIAVAVLLALASVPPALAQVHPQPEKTIVEMTTMIRPSMPDRPATPPDWDRSYQGMGKAQHAFAFQGYGEYIPFLGDDRTRFATTLPEMFTRHLYDLGTITRTLPDSGFVWVLFDPKRFGPDFTSRECYGKLVMGSIRDPGFHQLATLVSADTTFVWRKIRFKYPEGMSREDVVYYLYVQQNFSGTADCPTVEEVSPLLRDAGRISVSNESDNGVSNFQASLPWPNPVRNETINISLTDLPVEGIKITIVNQLGQEVAQREVAEAGPQTFDVADFAPGVYVMRFSATSTTRLFVVL